MSISPILGRNFNEELFSEAPSFDQDIFNKEKGEKSDDKGKSIEIMKSDLREIRVGNGKKRGKRVNIKTMRMY